MTILMIHYISHKIYLEIFKIDISLIQPFLVLSNKNYMEKQTYCKKTITE